MLTGTERREEIVKCIKTSHGPIPGKTLAQNYGVSRQVIVQDIALIRASGYSIISTNKGYILNDTGMLNVASRIFKVKHTDAQLEEELYSILDLGGRIVNVMINHRVYGHMEAKLNIGSRKQAVKFLEDIKSGKSTPLKNITSDYHYHTIEADSEEILDLVEEMLREKGFLVAVGMEQY